MGTASCQLLKICWWWCLCPCRRKHSLESSHCQWGREGLRDLPTSPPFSLCANQKDQRTREELEMWMGELGNRNSQRLDGERSRVKDKRDCLLPANHLGQEDSSHLQEEWRGSCLSFFPLLSPAQTPAPSSSSLLSPYFPSGTIPLALPPCQVQYWGILRTTQSGQSSADTEPSPS